jgi:SAM-dependent methyltransferase
MTTEFTGERVIPGEVDADLLNEHLARYAFAARLAHGKRVLDAGCGCGYGSAELAKPALWVLGADNAAAAVDFAREHYRLPNLHFEQASCGALPHPDASFDLVVAFEVIEHLDDWRVFLREIQRVLAPAGQFMVSTPNKLYYTESRRRAGPNPFHAHEFEFREFREELESVFPDISIFLENHVEGVVFRPAEAVEACEVRLDGAAPAPAEAHFFVAVCGHRALGRQAAFMYIPSSANVLRERETHIALLEGELRQKNVWLEEAKRELAELDTEHGKLLGELEERNRWAARLNSDLEAAGGRIEQLQDELAQEQASAAEVVRGYESKIAELQEDNQAKAAWGRQLDAAIAAKSAELAQCVEYLHRAEKTVEERTQWAQSLQAEIEQLRGKLSAMEASRWVRLGRSVGLGPDVNQP